MSEKPKPFLSGEQIDLFTSEGTLNYEAMTDKQLAGAYESLIGVKYRDDLGKEGLIALLKESEIDRGKARDGERARLFLIDSKEDREELKRPYRGR